MTREESQEDYVDGVKVRNIIDAIYDDIESRTCENCKHYGKNGWCEVLDIGVNTDFGCKEVARKDKNEQ